MEYKEVFDRIIQMERVSARNPNLMQTYEVLWKTLKEEIQFDKIPRENLTKHNNDFKKPCPICKGKKYQRNEVMNGEEPCLGCNAQGFVKP